MQILDVVSKRHFDAPTQKLLTEAAVALSARWEHEPADAMRAVLRSSILRVDVHPDKIDIQLNRPWLIDRLLNNVGGVKEPISGKRNLDADDHNPSENQLTTLSIFVRLKRTGKEMKFVIDGDSDPRPADVSLIRLFLRAQRINKRLLGAAVTTLEEIAAEEDICPSYATRLMRLNFLAPNIVAAILAGKQPADLTANKLMADTRLPLDWRDQRRALGFVSAPQAL